jgi:ATP-dependent Lon protease
MEVLDISGYTYRDKEEIAKRYLIPKEMDKNGINEKLIAFTDDGVKAIIEGYTKEAGVRNLEREIGSVCRKVATEYSLTKKKKLRTITEKNINKYLGVRKFEGSEKLENAEIGVATGLAWTQFGGTTLSIEVNLMEGKGNLILTGKLGEVMQESAKTAFSHIKAKVDEYGIDKEILEKKDLHIHVPEGATPKDGPSAGITIATAILSALLGKRVDNNIAMTGEITLRGRVLAIGGLKEKALAAYRIGIKKVIIPEANLKDLEDIPHAIRSQIKFIPVSEVTKVFAEAFKK